jgi:hypothetical protein
MPAPSVSAHTRFAYSGPLDIGSFANGGAGQSQGEWAVGGQHRCANTAHGCVPSMCNHQLVTDASGAAASQGRVPSRPSINPTGGAGHSAASTSGMRFSGHNLRSVGTSQQAPIGNSHGATGPVQQGSARKRCRTGGPATPNPAPNPRPAKWMFRKFPRRNTVHCSGVCTMRHDLTIGCVCVWVGGGGGGGRPPPPA